MKYRPFRLASGATRLRRAPWSVPELSDEASAAGGPLAQVTSTNWLVPPRSRFQNSSVRSATVGHGHRLGKKQAYSRVGGTRHFMPRGWPARAYGLSQNAWVSCWTLLDRRAGRRPGLQGDSLVSASWDTGCDHAAWRTCFSPGPTPTGGAHIGSPGCCLPSHCFRDRLIAAKNSSLLPRLGPVQAGRSELARSKKSATGRES